MTLGSRAAVVDGEGATAAVLPTWSDAALVAEALGMRCARYATSHPEQDSPESVERQMAKWPEVTDSGWAEALTRLRGAEFAAAWRAARMGPHPTPEAAEEAMAAFAARWR